MAQPNLFSQAKNETAHTKPITVITPAPMHVTTKEEEPKSEWFADKEEPPVRKIIPQDMKTAQETNHVKSAFNLELPLGNMIDGAVRDYVENKSGIADYIEKMIAHEVAKKQPNVITINTKPPVKIDGKLHARFERCLTSLTLKKQIFVSGPAGTGKTTLAEQLAAALNVKFGFISCTAGTSEAQLTGRMIADGSFLSSSFVDCYENGGLFLFDEVDAADSNTMLLINSALANGNLSLPNRVKNNIAKRHAEFYCVCAANTWGHGSNEYVGRNPLDAAFLDRFVLTKIPVTYDIDLEKQLCKDHPTLANALWKIRANLADQKVKRLVSTRAFIDGALFASNKHSVATILDMLMEDWNAQEKVKGMNMVRV